jgi:nucleoside-diphosphate-sugar epimerase
VRVAVLGGTGFIGGYVVRALVEDGHDVTVFHRGIDETDLPPSVRHLHGSFDRLAWYRDTFQRQKPDVVLDMVPYIDKGGHGITHLRGIAQRAVVISSGDVYRAFGRLWRSEPGPPDPVPLREDSPLRTLPAPDGKGEDDFDNLDVERAALADEALPATILRLPATHGPGDRQHRLARYLRSMREGRAAIVLAEAHARWRWSRGYVENVAAAVALAVGDERGTGRIYNVAAEPAVSEADWIRSIANLTGWKGEVRIVPDSDLPLARQRPFDFTQHLEVDTTSIRSDLGFREIVDDTEGLRRTIDWELQTLDNVPELRLDYAAEDEALKAALGGDHSRTVAQAPQRPR